MTASLHSRIDVKSVPGLISTFTPELADGCFRTHHVDFLRNFVQRSTLKRDGYGRPSTFKVPTYDPVPTAVMGCGIL